MKLIRKGDIIFGVRAVRNASVGCIDDSLWDILVYGLWNEVEFGMGMSYSTPTAEHEDDWIGSVK